MAKSLDERFKERNFLPALKPRKWQARKAVFCRRLVDDEHDTVPLVAYGWDSPDRTEFVTREAIADAGASKSRAHKYAIRNLARRARKVKWNKQRYPMGRKKVAVAMVEGDEFTGSCVLVPEFLEAAHDLLDCETLVIGIPNRFSLWACDAALAPLMISFAEAQFEEAEEDEREPVTSALILSQNGKLAGIAVGEAEAESPRSKTKDRERKTKDRDRKTKDRERKTKDRDRKTKDRDRKTKDRSKKKSREESSEDEKFGLEVAKSITKVFMANALGGHGPERVIPKLKKLVRSGTGRRDRDAEDAIVDGFTQWVGIAAGELMEGADAESLLETLHEHEVPQVYAEGIVLGIIEVMEDAEEKAASKKGRSTSKKKAPSKKKESSKKKAPSKKKESSKKKEPSKKKAPTKKKGPAPRKKRRW